jgi:hypothetical protein
VEAFLPDENGWRVLPKLHRPVNASSLVFVDPFLMLFSGGALVAYDLRAKHSESIRVGYQATRETATVVLNGRIYVFGGTRGNLTTDDSMAAFFLPAPVAPATRRYEPDEKSAEQDAISFADTDKLNLVLNRDKDYSARDEIQVFEIRRAAR